MEQFNKIMAYDSSALVFVGANITTSRYGKAPQSIWNTEGIPTGGIFHFLRTFFTDLKTYTGKDCAIVPAFESLTNYRKEIYPFYKGNRTTYRSIQGDEIDTNILKNLSIKAWYNEFDQQTRKRFALKESSGLQIKIIKALLEDVGVKTYSVDGCEADDILYMVAIYMNYYNTNCKITIRCDDHDLADTKGFNHNVRLQGVTSKSTIASVPVGELLNKIMGGCTSDNIPSLPNGVEKSVLYDAISQGVVNPFDIKNGFTVDPTPLYQLGLSEDFVNQVLRNIYLVTPTLVELPEIQSTVRENLDWDKMYIWLSTLAQAKFCKETLHKEIDRTLSEVRDKVEEIQSLISPCLRDYIYKENQAYLR